MCEGFLSEGFVYVRDFVPDVIEDMRYAGTDNFVGAKVDGYEKRRAILTRQAALALRDMADGLRMQGYRLMIFDAYRPRRAVAHFLRWAADVDDVRMREKYYPEILDKADILKKGFVAAKSSHSRGSTVDLTLTDAAGTPLNMGTGFDLFSPLAAHGAPGIAEEAAENRALLCRQMIGAGIKPYNNEWWHYTLQNEPFPDQDFDFAVR